MALKKKIEPRTRTRRNVAGSSYTDTYPLLTLRDVVVFPGMVAPLYVGRAKSIAAVEDAMLEDKRILLVTQRQPEIDEPLPTDLFDVGCMGEILQMLKLPDGNLKILVQGQTRMTVRNIRSTDRGMRAQADLFHTPRLAGAEVEAWKRVIRDSFEQYVKLGRRIPQETLYSVLNIEEADRMVDHVAAYVDAKVEDKQMLLSTRSLGKRLEKLSSLLNSENEILDLEQKLKGEVRSQMERSQREYYLNEQMKAIQRELGKGGENAEEVAEIQAKIEAAGMPEPAEEKALKELDRLANMPSMSPEATVVRNYLDWLVEVPWSKKSDETLDINKAAEILEADHYGLEKPKERILEFLAVRQLAGENSRIPILCFVGPPGVGKTSLGHSIARSLNREVTRISLGGVRDEAEIRGHRRTYIGALPGRIIQSLRRVGTRNPVFLLDEVDKMSVDFRGDPSAALLEVLDPELNNTFSDHYLEVEFDLSDAFFITTANVLHPIPSPLRDRMEIIEIPSYTEDEKVQIASRYLVPKQLKANGLEKKIAKFNNNSLRTIIREYTHEAGVRNLDREIGSVCRKIAKRIAASRRRRKVDVTSAFVRKNLGIPRYTRSSPVRGGQVGVATGLSWTQVGGEVLNIEVTSMAGKGNLTLTGQLGEVMQESARAALSYARSHAKELGIDPEFHGKTDLHIHVPEGAIPKDGPSAGITMAVALISELTGRKVLTNVAMTGEITLRGRVLPVGGIKEKVLAAHREGIRTVLLPHENKKDLEDIPKNVRDEMQFKFLKSMDEVVSLTLESKGKKKAPAKATKKRATSRASSRTSASPPA